MRSMGQWGASALLGIFVLGCMQHVVHREPGPVGRPVGDIEGPGPTGELMRLSDQRGKVVLLSFWHNN